jgi:hypothetical protein
MEVPKQAILSLFFRPTPIPIHDDGNVPGQVIFINLVE